MKPTSLILPALLLTACSVDNLSENLKNNTVIQAVAEAAAPDARTAADPTEYTSGEVGINWLPADKVGVFGDKTTANAPFANQSSTETDKTTFAGTLAASERALYAYYPYTESAGTDYTAVHGTIPTRQNYSTATRALEADWKYGYAVADNRFSFRHAFAMLRFEVNGTGTALDGEKLVSVTLNIPGHQLGGDFALNIATGSYTLTPGTGDESVVMTWTDTPALSAKTHYGYMTVAPATGLAGKTVTVSVKTDRHTATFSTVMKADALVANTFYTVPLTLSAYHGSWKLEENPDAPAEPNAAWVPSLSSHLATANTVYGVPGQPFMHKIRVPQSASQTAHAVVPVKTGIKRVWNLPEGLQWNASRCLVHGTAPAAGDYTYSVEFELDGTTYSEGIRLHVSDNLISPTPMMGWQSWNVLEKKVDYSSLCQITDAMVSNGYQAAGYKYIGIDDYWQAGDTPDNSRDASGKPIADSSKFPAGLVQFTSYAHSKGFKTGIYTDCGTLTCAGCIGSYGYEAVDAAQYIAWGFDMVKEDWFWSGHGEPAGITWDQYDAAVNLYTRMGTALGGRMLLYACEWGQHEPWRWGAEASASCWRMSQDARDCWTGKLPNGTNWLGQTQYKENLPTQNHINAGIGLRNTIDLMRNIWPYVGINRYNDADMLCVGIRGAAGSAQDLVNTKHSDYDVAYETNFAMWCMYSSPLLITYDVRNTSVNAHDKALLLNDELIAIDQDPMGQGAEWVKTVSGMDYYMKDLANGDVAVAVVNLNDKAANYTINIADFEALDASASYAARNLLARADAGTLSASSALSGSLAAHATFIVRLSKK